MTMHPFDFSVVDVSWQECLSRGLAKVDAGYLQKLHQSQSWLPGPQKIFNAFSLPLHRVNYVLFGESPYPRRESANGYAFWDAAVKELWSPTGLSKKVNRATSFRNIIKMLLVAENALNEKQVNQAEIAKLDKQAFTQSNEEFFHNLLNQGFLLLNAALVLQETTSPDQDARAWSPFLKELLNCLLEKRPQVKFILLGRVATTIDKLLADHPHLEKLYAEHPYNCSFITNSKVLDFFRPLHLLKRA